MYYVYILQSNDRFYVGYTTRLEGRLEEHNAGLNISTKAFRPWKIIYFESHLNQLDALRREKYFKTTQGRLSLRRMLREYLTEQNVKL